PHLEVPVNRVMPLPHMTRMAGSVPTSQIWTSSQSITHPPGYSLMLRVWRLLFGESDLAVQALSILCSVAAVALLYDVGRRLLNDPILPLWACAIMAVAQPQIEYAQLVRPYATLIFLGTLLLWFMTRIETDSSGGKARWNIGIAVSVFCMLLLHYFAV